MRSFHEATRSGHYRVKAANRMALRLTRSGRRGPEGEVLQITWPVGADERYASGADVGSSSDGRLALMADWQAMSGPSCLPNSSIYLATWRSSRSRPGDASVPRQLSAGSVAVRFSTPVELAGNRALERPFPNLYRRLAPIGWLGAMIRPHDHPWPIAFCLTRHGLHPASAAAPTFPGTRRRAPDRARPGLHGRDPVHGPHLHPWALLPVDEFGCGSVTTCWRRFAEWAHAGVFERLQELLPSQARVQAAPGR
jgi:hypothetical protein